MYAGVPCAKTSLHNVWRGYVTARDRVKVYIFAVVTGMFNASSCIKCRMQLSMYFQRYLLVSNVL